MNAPSKRRKPAKCRSFLFRSGLHQENSFALQIREQVPKTTGQLNNRQINVDGRQIGLNLTFGKLAEI